MANLKEKIQDLLKNTTSQEVKSVCESFLKETDGKDINPTDMIAESLFTNLKNYVNVDSKVGSLLNEKEGHSKSIADIEAQISREAAQRFSDNWDTTRRDKKVSNVGNHVQNSLINENKAKAAENSAILEKLSGLDDVAAKKFVEKSKIDNYCVRESIEAIKGSQIASHPNLKYVLAKFESSILENTSEFLLVSDFLSQITPFKWDPTVKAATVKIQESINSKAADLEVQQTIHAIKSTDNKRFFTDITNRMSEWLYSDNKSVHELVKEMKSYMFNPHVKELTNRLQLMENSKGTQFNIPVKDSNCSVERIVSPVHVDAATNGQVFKAGANFYHAAEGKFKKLTEAQINALPKEFLELCESFFNPHVKVLNENITIYLGNTKVRFDGEKRIFVNEKQIDPSTLGSQLMFHTQQTIFRNTSNMANVAMNIYENLDNICEIDYGKAVLSNVFEGVGAYLFKTNGKIYINKVNPSMNENSFVSANALQTVNLVKEFLSFNMSESLAEFLEGDFKKKAMMESEMDAVLSNIQILEAELDKIEKAILEDPSYADIKEIADAKTLIENELNNLKSQWQSKSDELKNFETVIEKNGDDEEEEEEEPKDEETEEPKEDAEPADDKAAPADDVEDAEAANVATDAPADNTDPEANAEVTDTPPTPEGTATAADTTGTPDGENMATAPAGSATSVVDNGLLGAEGTQAAATGIPGNDHMDANAGGATGDAQIMDAGFVGAAGTQQNGTAAMQTADVISQEAPATPVLTPGADTAQVIPGGVSAEIPTSSTDAAPADAPVDNTPTADNTDDATAAAGTSEAPADADAVVIDVVAKDGDKEPEVKENKNTISENIRVDSKVKDKVSGQNGTVTAINDEEFSILLDGGETVERALGDLEDVADEIEQNITNNEKPIEDPANAATADSEEGMGAPGAYENEEATTATPGEEGQDTEKEEAMFVQATLTIDLGPFKAGDTVEIDAANYTSSGDDDAIKLKEPKDGVNEIPKKYLNVADAKPVDGGDDADSKVAAVLQQIADLETFLNDENTKGSKAIEDAKEKIRKFAKTLEPKEDAAQAPVDDKSTEPKADDEAK